LEGRNGENRKQGNIVQTMINLASEEGFEPATDLILKAAYTHTQTKVCVDTGIEVKITYLTQRDFISYISEFVEGSRELLCTIQTLPWSC
jgi:hypothetical protein